MLIPQSREKHLCGLRVSRDRKQLRGSFAALRMTGADFSHLRMLGSAIPQARERRQLRLREAPMGADRRQLGPGSASLGSKSFVWVRAFVYASH